MATRQQRASGQVLLEGVGGKLRYPGVRAFGDDPDDRVLFQGREAEAEALFHLVMSEPLVLLFGKSGFGKSSLINAGLLHLLRNRGYFPVVTRVNDPDAGPTQEMYQAIADTAERAGIDYVPGNPASQWHFFKTVRLTQNGDDLTPVVIIDQFEEIFTLQGWKKREEFTERLADVVRGRRPRLQVEGDDDLDDQPPPVKIVLSMREDFLVEAAELAQHIPPILKARFRLGALTREQAGQAIVEPAGNPDPAFACPPFTWSTDALNVLLDFLCERLTRGGPRILDEVEPFQLQLICQHIEEDIAERAKEGTRPLVVERQDLEPTEKLQGLLTNFYESAIHEATPTSAMRRNLWEMCEIGLISDAGRRLPLETSDIRRRFRVDGNALSDLEGRRLLRQETRGGDQYYELSHDTLIKSVHQSRDVRRRKELRTKAVAATVGVGVVLGLVATFWFPYARNQTAVANARTAYYENDDPTAAVSYLISAPENTRGWANIASDIIASPIPTRVLRDNHTGGIRAVAFTPDGARFVTASMDGTARLWRIEDDGDQSVKTFAGHTGIVRTAAIDPTGTWLATGSSDGTVRIWRIDADHVDGACDLPSCIRIDHTEAIRALAFKPGGGALLTASEDGTAVITNFSDLTSVAYDTVLHHAGPVYTAAFYSDGDLAVSTRNYVYALSPGRGQVASRDSLRLCGEALGSARFASHDNLLLVRRGGGATIWRRGDPTELAVARGASTPRAGCAAPPAERSPQQPALADGPPREWRVLLATVRNREDASYVALLHSDGRIGYGRATRDSVEHEPVLVEHQGEGRPVAVTIMGNAARDSFQLMTAWSDGTIRLWKRLESLGRDGYVELRHPGLRVAEVSPDGKWLVTGSADGSTRVWDLKKLARATRNPLMTELKGQPRFSPDSAAMLIEYPDSAPSELWTAQGRDTVPDPIDGLFVANGYVILERGRVGAINYRDSLVATTSDEGVRVLSMDRSLLRVYPDSVSTVAGMAFDTTGGNLILYRGSQLLGIDLGSDSSTTVLFEGVLSVSFDPHGNRALVVATLNGHGAVRLIDLAGDSVSAPIRTEGPVNRATFTRSHGGAVLFIGPRQSSTAYRWDLGAGPPDIIPGKRGINAAEVDDTRDRSILGAWDGAAVAIGSRPPINLPTTVGQVQHVAFHPVDDRVLTATDFAAHLWTEVNGRYSKEESWTVEPPTGEVERVAFTRDGSAVIIYGSAGVWLWHISPQGLRRAMCRASGDADAC